MIACGRQIDVFRVCPNMCVSISKVQPATVIY
jgi:hypothetical protein